MNCKYFIIPLSLISIACIQLPLTDRQFAERAIIRDHFDLTTSIDSLPRPLFHAFLAFLKEDRRAIADRGNPWNASDIRIDTLPNYCFILSGVSTSHAFVLYEAGGYSVEVNLLVFEVHKGRFVALWEGNRPPGVYQLTEIQQAIKEGQFQTSWRL